MKVTQYQIIPFNGGLSKTEMQGDFNLVNPCLSSYIRTKKRESYFFEVENNGKTTYLFNLKNDEFETFKLFFPCIENHKK